MDYGCTYALGCKIKPHSGMRWHGRSSIAAYQQEEINFNPIFSQLKFILRLSRLIVLGRTSKTCSVRWNGKMACLTAAPVADCSSKYQEFSCDLNSKYLHTFLGTPPKSWFKAVFSTDRPAQTNQDVRKLLGLMASEPATAKEYKGRWGMF